VVGRAGPVAGGDAGYVDVRAGVQGAGQADGSYRRTTGNAVPALLQ
jgi:hypothetical protein